MVKNSSVSSFARSFLAALAAAALGLLLVAAAGRADSASVNWTSPTPADKARFNVSPGKALSFTLTASTAEPGGVVHIEPAQPLPNGVSFNSSDGAAARATFSWTPDAPGNYAIAFTATLVGTATTAPTLTYSVHVKGKVLSYPFISTLTDQKLAGVVMMVEQLVVLGTFAYLVLRSRVRHTRLVHA